MRRLWLPLLAAALIPSAASSAEDQGIVYDCDTASGHFSVLMLPAPGQNFTVTGKIELRAMAEIGDYVPLARLAIVDRPDDAGSAIDDSVGFKLTALPERLLRDDGGDDPFQMLSWDARTGGEAHEARSFVPQTAGPLQFRLSYDGSEAKVEIDGKQQVFALSTRSPAVRVICSTGEFLFTDLLIEEK